GRMTAEASPPDYAEKLLLPPLFLARFALRFSLRDFCAVFFWSFFGFAEPFMPPSYGADATTPTRSPASSTKRQSAFTSRMSSIVRQRTSSSFGDATSTATDCAREIATLRR